MKLNDKIYYCRKRSGLSQEDLAERLGVSRQSVSKWETGAALPEIDKLTVLAAVFGVTTDWLLSDAEPEAEDTDDCRAENRGNPYGPTSQAPAYPEWMDRAPHFIASLLRRFGWLFGVYVSVVGAIMMGFGGIAKLMSSFMVDSFSSSTSSMTNGFGDPFFSQPDPFFDSFVEESTRMLENNPVTVIANVLLIVGAVVVVGGIVLAVILKRYSKM